MARDLPLADPVRAGCVTRLRLIGRFVVGGATASLATRLALAALGGGAAAALLATLLGRA